MTLRDVVAEPTQRALVAADAVTEAERAVRARTGLSGMAAQFGLDTINRLRPGFLERHVTNLLPGWAEAVDPWWNDGVAQGDPAQWLMDHALEVAEALLNVTDDYVDRAEDQTAIAVYHKLRNAAPKRIAAEMGRIGQFIGRWAS